MTTSNKKFIGKKLLLLGTSPGSVDMVNYARSQGAYVIVTDNQPIEKSAAKQIADEAWLVSTADVDTLEKLAIKHEVKGILAGISEFNLEKALTLCERLGLPFYCTRKQWGICLNKRRFKKLCLANDVPVPREYKVDSDSKPENLKQIKYPVIVKPVDRSGGIGIRICHDENSMLRAYEKALSLSASNEAIIEEFIEGDEFSAGYTIKDGQFSLSYVTSGYLNPDPGENIPLPQAVIVPSKYTDKYLAELNERVIKMFKSIYLNNGFIFVQGMVNSGGFYINETNFRFAVSRLYRFISKVNGINYMEMLVNHALTGKMEGYDLSLDNPRFKKYCCYLSLISQGGLVAKIIGLEEIKNKESLIAVDKMYDIGDFILRSGTLGQMHMRFLLMRNSIQDIKNSIDEIQNTVKVLDDKGNDMLLPPFDTNRV